MTNFNRIEQFFILCDFLWTKYYFDILDNLIFEIERCAVVKLSCP